MRYWIAVLHGNVRGILISMIAVAAICAPVFILTARLQSPVLTRQEVTGDIVSFRNGPANPKTAAGRGHWIDYTVRLTDGNGFAVVRGPTGLLLPIGSRVVLERTARENGLVRHTLKDSPWMRVGY